MTAISPNVLTIRKALKGTRKVYSIARHPKLHLAADGKGGGSWRIKYRLHPNANQRWLTISNDARNVAFDEVVRKAGALLSDLALKGIDPRTARPKPGDTFGETFELWLDRYAKAHKKSWAFDEKYYHRHIKARLGRDLFRSIDRLRVIEVLDDIAKKATPLQANRAQSLISAVFSWALDEGRIVNHPALRIRRRGLEKSREFVMSDEQLRAFWRRLDDVRDNTKFIIQLLTLLGCRLGEVSGAQHRELVLREGTAQWTIPGERTKNGLSLIVPLPPVALSLFRSAVEASKTSSFVFPARRVEPSAFDGNHASRQCKEIFRAIEVPHMRLHDLRHQAATGMAQCGVPLDIRQMVQNQITGRRQAIGSIYDQHDYSAEKRRSLELWERRLIAIVAGHELPTERY